MKVQTNCTETKSTNPLFSPANTHAPPTKYPYSANISCPFAVCFFVDFDAEYSFPELRIIAPRPGYEFFFGFSFSRRRVGVSRPGLGTRGGMRLKGGGNEEEKASRGGEEGG